MSMRDEFEKVFPVPAGIYWNEISEQYDGLPGSVGLDEIEAYQARFDGWQAAQAPVSWEVEPVAWANVLEWMESPLIYPFAYKAQAEAAADRNSGTVRPLIFGDTHPPAKVPEWWVADIREAAKHIAGFESAPSQLAGSLFRISDALLTTPTPATTPETELPKGWKLLPVHATADMVRRGKRAHGEEFLFNQDPDTNIQSIWKAMIAIAPEPPTAQEGE